MSGYLYQRVAVTYPIYDNSIKQRIIDIITIQLNDNINARNIDASQVNLYHYFVNSPKTRDQMATHHYLKKQQLKSISIYTSGKIN